MVKKFGLLFLIALSLSSCVSSEKIHYFQGAPLGDNPAGSATNFQTKLRSDDLLMIVVSAPDPMAAAPFNLSPVGISAINLSTIDNATGQQRFQSYLIDSEGNIEFPVLGTVTLGGLTRAEAMEKLVAGIKKYIDKPIVNLRIMNYKVTVEGEVLRPGTYNIISERITIPEALGMASDMTIYGDRKEVMVIRDINGVKTFNTVDMTSASVVNSPYYYLSQNDVVYVKPNNTRVNSSAVGPNTSLIISAVSLLITTIALLTR